MQKQFGYLPSRIIDCIKCLKQKLVQLGDFRSIRTTEFFFFLKSSAQGKTVCYTDGSKTEEEVGRG